MAFGEEFQEHWSEAGQTKNHILTVRHGDGSGSRQLIGWKNTLIVEDSKTPYQTPGDTVMTERITLRRGV